MEKRRKISLVLGIQAEGEVSSVKGSKPDFDVDEVSGRDGAHPWREFICVYCSTVNLAQIDDEFFIFVACWKCEGINRV